MRSLVAVIAIDPRVVALVAGLTALALGLAVAGWTGATIGGPLAARDTRFASRVGLAIGCAIVGFLLTRWPVVGFYGGVGGWFIPILRAARAERRAAVARVDAIADWIETVRGSVAGYAGLQQALRSSAEFAPESIRVEVHSLVARLQHNTTSSAVRNFASDMAHPMSDLVAACLMLTERSAAGNLPQVLAMTAQTARDNATLLRQVEAGRSSTQSQGRLVAIVTAFVSVMLVIFRRDFLASYDNLAGQIALFIICSIFFASGAAMYRLSKPAEVQRVFGRVGAEDQAAPIVEDPSVEGQTVEDRRDDVSPLESRFGRSTDEPFTGEPLTDEHDQGLARLITLESARGAQCSPQP